MRRSQKGSSRTTKSTKRNGGIQLEEFSTRTSTRGVPTLQKGSKIKFHWALNEWYIGTLSRLIKKPIKSRSTNKNPVWWLVSWKNDPSDSIVDLSPATYKLRKKPGQWIEEINNNKNSKKRGRGSGDKPRNVKKKRSSSTTTKNTTKPTTKPTTKTTTKTTSHQTNSSSSSSSSSSTTTSTTNGTAISRQIQKIADQLIISKLQTRDGKYKMTDTAATIQDATHILNEVTRNRFITLYPKGRNTVFSRYTVTNLPKTIGSQFFHMFVECKLSECLKLPGNQLPITKKLDNKWYNLFINLKDRITADKSKMNDIASYFGWGLLHGNVVITLAKIENTAIDNT